ncbi:MAG: mechanosensitive ion channel family protein [Candidatus Alcyoniella australis]|nr:mechanosensitive ion channel family protein [Candidatus Alcyoniella australis]
MLQIEFFDNTLLAWVAALAVLLLGTGLLWLLRPLTVRLLEGRVARRPSRSLKLALEMVRRTNYAVLLFVALWAACALLVIPAKVRGLVGSLAMIMVFVQFGLWGGVLVNSGVRSLMLKGRDETTATGLSVISFLARIAVWSAVALLILDNLGVNITTLVAGLGVGGIAIGLAVQNILGDLFASFSIILDRPFEVGDFIIVDELMGNVEKIGLKTTRVRSLSGEQLVFSNGDLLQSRIRNYKRMAERRVLFGFGVLYSTPLHKLEQIPTLVRAIIEAQERVRFDRAHFKEYGDSSLNFEVVYSVLDRDYNLYMDIQQAINLALFKQFGEQGIDFAFPTLTVHMVQPPAD